MPTNQSPKHNQHRFLYVNEEVTPSNDKVLPFSKIEQVDQSLLENYRYLSIFFDTWISWFLSGRRIHIYEMIREISSISLLRNMQ